MAGNCLLAISVRGLLSPFDNAKVPSPSPTCMNLNFSCFTVPGIGLARKGICVKGQGQDIGL